MNLINFLMSKAKVYDTGLRGTYSGRLYVDKKVFYKRPEVVIRIERLKEIIESLRNSK